VAKIDHATVRVNAVELLRFCQIILGAQGVPEEQACYVAWHLVETNLRGTDSHGVARLPHYVRRLKGKSIKAQPAITYEQRAPSLGLVDGDNGLGHLVMRDATEKAGDLASQTGAGWVAVKNSSHCGALAPYGLQLAERGMIAFVFSHVDPMVLPHGSRVPFCGTNPICITAPSLNGCAMCLDMATSVVPWNLIANAATEGVPIPSGWAVDRQGVDTNKPCEVHALYPFAQHKGSGLGILIDILCSLLSGGPYGPDIPKMYGDMTEPRQLGGLVGAIHVEPFMESSIFRARVSEIMRRLSGLPPSQGTDRVRFPGEPEIETKRIRSRDGIPMGINVLAELNELASQCGSQLLQPL
jgi:ureidoglycolate dehydrogenase (NAD+)